MNPAIEVIKTVIANPTLRVARFSPVLQHKTDRASKELLRRALLKLATFRVIDAIDGHGVIHVNDFIVDVPR